MKKRLCSILLAAVLVTGLIPGAAAAYGFHDVPQGHWAGASIQRTVEGGWMNGVGSGSFAPDKTLTAAELYTMIVNVFFTEELNAWNTPGTSVWYAKACSLAEYEGLFRGTSYEGGKSVTTPVNRYDMAQGISNVLAAKAHISADGSVPAPLLSDWGSCPQRYRSAVASCYQQGILSGKNGRFAGEDVITRAEAAVVLCKTADVVAAKALDPKELAAEVVRLTNEMRAKEGLPAYGTYDELTAAAELRAPELETLFSHTRPDGSSCITALGETGANKGVVMAGENIFVGSASPEVAVQEWMNSPGHRENILHKGFTHIGVAYSNGNWVQVFVAR